jgi:hypothetical protein
MGGMQIFIVGMARDFLSECYKSIVMGFLVRLLGVDAVADM